MKAGSINSAIVIGSVSVVLIGGLMIYAGLFAQASLIQTFDSTLTPAAAKATFTMTGNVTQNETVNFTISPTSSVNFAFNVNGTGLPGVPAGYNQINITNGVNSSGIATQNLTNAINNNATLNAIITAANVSGTTSNGTIITRNVVGSDGNYGIQSLSDVVANGAWSSATLTGGTDGMGAYANTKTNVNSAFVILGVVLIFAGIGGLIATVFGLVGKSGVRQ